MRLPLRLGLLGSLAAPLLACLGLGGGGTYAGARASVAGGDAAAVDALLAAAGRTADDLAVLPAADWGRSAEPAVVVQDGRVTHLRLRGAGLASMAAVAPLDALRELDLSGNAVPRIEGLGAARSLEVLTLRDNALADLGGLGACTALRWLYLDGNRIRSLAGLAVVPALADLSLNNNQLTTLDGIGGRRALTGLYVANNHLVDLSGLRDLPALATLSANGNRIARLDGIAGAPALQNVSLADNAIADAGPLAALPALKWVDLARNPLATAPRVGPGVTVEGVAPAGTAVAEAAATGTAAATASPAAAPAPAAGATEGTSATLPAQSGTVTSGSSSRGAGFGGLFASGRWGGLSGTSCPSFGKGRSILGVRVTVAVESGRVRVWVRDGAAYRWKLAEPGRPADLAGAPIDRPGARAGVDRYQVCIEAVDGPASGVSYEVRGS